MVKLFLKCYNVIGFVKFDKCSKYSILLNCSYNLTNPFFLRYCVLTIKLSAKKL